MSRICPDVRVLLMTGDAAEAAERRAPDRFRILRKPPRPEPRVAAVNEILFIKAGLPQSDTL
ncbi:MAG: hypothetical protein ACOYX1_17615 [Acidobacteriota bacterium]